MKLFARPYHAMRWAFSGDPIRTTWTSGGIARDVTTYHNPGESAAHWSQRHITALKAALALYPPDAQALTQWTSGGAQHYIQSNDTSAIASALTTYPPDV